MEQSDETNLHLLHDWLRSEINNKNILIPTSVGGKRPTRRYKDDVWTWEEYDKMIEIEKKQQYQYQQKKDWGIILKDICVVDVDSPAVAASLEARFPELLLAPCAETKHGFHYYFRRSKLADDSKYYDGAGQRLNKVDFKSITRTGTGGFIVVPPSADKKWIQNRSPWETNMISIPDALLSTVARPYGKSDKATSTRCGVSDHNVVPMDKSTSNLDNNAPKPKFKLKESSNAPMSEKIVELIFENDDKENMIVSGFQFQLLAESDYFGALLSGRWAIPENTNDDDSTNSSSVRTLTMPCDRNVCEEIFSLLQTEMMTHSSEPTIKLLAKIDSTMDMLGIFYSKNPLLFRSAFFADLYDINRDMWHVHCHEIELMLGTSATASDLSLVCIDDDLAQCTGYTPMKKDARWIFEELPCMLPGAKYENVKVFVDQPEDTLISQMPLAVLAILRRHPTNIVVAGGAVLGGISNFVDHGSDVDLFVHGLDQEQSSALLVDIEDFIQKEYKYYTITKSLAAVTFTNNEDNSKDKYGNINGNNLLDRPFQIVLGLHRARSQVIEHFDLTPCKCLARIDENSEFIIEALPSFVLALTHMSFFVDIMYWTPCSVTRITKYIAKGFECFVPGLKRPALKVSTQGNGGWSPYYDRTKGLSLLFVAESEVINSRNFSSEEEFTFVEPITGRLRPIEASVIASKVAQKLGNGVSATNTSPMYGHMRTGTYGFITERFRRDVAVRLGDHRNGIPIGTVFFAFTEAGRFNPSDACLEDMYDHELLAAIATEEMAARALKMSTMPICSSCGSTTTTEKKFKKCPCGEVRYCDTTCQRIHWKQSHKVVCQCRKNKNKNEPKRERIRIKRSK
jgi:hypothetical protein